LTENVKAQTITEKTPHTVSLQILGNQSKGCKENLKFQYFIIPLPSGISAKVSGLPDMFPWGFGNSEMQSHFRQHSAASTHPTQLGYEGKSIFNEYLSRVCKPFTVYSDSYHMATDINKHATVGAK
jgi:hypothetical protein